MKLGLPNLVDNPTRDDPVAEHLGVVVIMGRRGQKTRSKVKVTGLTSAWAWFALFECP